MITFDETHSNGDEAALQCPNCGCPNLHQMSVDVYARQEDEATERVHINNYSGDVSRTTGHLADWANPSSRRHGVSITFTCEHCYYGDPSGDSYRPMEFPLDIWQHKGTTYMQWGDKINV